MMRQQSDQQLELSGSGGPTIPWNRNGAMEKDLRSMWTTSGGQIGQHGMIGLRPMRQVQLPGVQTTGVKLVERWLGK